jgi:hypothetical protein
MGEERFDVNFDSELFFELELESAEPSFYLPIWTPRLD